MFDGEGSVCAMIINKRPVISLALPIVQHMASNSNCIRLTKEEKENRIKSAQQIVELNGGGQVNQSVFRSERINRYTRCDEVIVHGIGIFKNQKEAADALGTCKSNVSWGLNNGRMVRGHKIGKVL